MDGSNGIRRLFFRLQRVIRTSLTTLKRAIAGLVVMNEEMENIYVAFLNNQVPGLYRSAAYPSLKPLASWVNDLRLRLLFIKRWIIRGQLKSYWISGFFYTQGFLTGLLQTHARKHDFPIDHLSFKFNVQQTYRDQATYQDILDVNDNPPEDDELDLPSDGALGNKLNLWETGYFIFSTDLFSPLYFFATGNFCNSCQHSNLVLLLFRCF